MQSERPLEDNDNTKPPVWELTKDRVKLTFANRALGEGAASWTLNLSPDRIKEAQRHPKGFTDSLKRDLDRALKRHHGFVPPYWFAVDTTARGRLHLHGGIAGGLDLPALERAMCHVGGKWDTRSGDRQFHRDIQRCDDGWVTYAIRHGAKVRRLIIGKSFTIPHELTRLGRAIYDQLRGREL